VERRWPGGAPGINKERSSNRRLYSSDLQFVDFTVGDLQIVDYTVRDLNFVDFAVLYF
jgi:hypothetical protein